MISANEDVNRGFVFSGRFETANQAAQISYEASQKIHNALKWLIHKQGIPIGDKILIAWGVDGSNQEDMFGSTDVFLGKDEDEGEKEAVADTQVEFAQRLKKAIYGKEQDLGHNEKIAFFGSGGSYHRTALSFLLSGIRVYTIRTADEDCGEMAFCP